VKIVYHPHLSSHLETYGIKVPLRDDRSKKTYESLSQEFEGQLKLTDISGWQPLDKDELLLVHSQEFVQALLDEENSESKIKECYELVDASGKPNRFDPELAKKPLSQMTKDILLQGRGTLKSMELALFEKMVFFLGGGMHHAMKEGGRGFCLVNDIVIGIRNLQSQHKIKNAWVIDIDAHKGDGTASLTVDDSSISTLSIHMEKGWPLDIGSGEGPWRLPSTIDIPIGYGHESEYLEKLEAGLIKLYGLSEENPGMAVVVAGADPFEKDALPSSHKLRLSADQMLSRDMLVYRFLVAKKIPQCWLMAGGYGPDSYRIYSQFLSKIMHEAE
jgi:acetoin utilization deacetylase AcuC-like enzyme